MAAATSYSISRALDATTQLFGAPYGPAGVPSAGEKGQALGPALSVSIVLGLEKMAAMADHLNQTWYADVYREQALLTRTAIDTLLWNSTGQFYAATLGAPGYDMMDIAQVLLAGIGSDDRRSQFTAKLAALKVPAGYSNGTRYAGTPIVVDPYYESFLLEGLAVAKQTKLAQDLLDASWAPMVRRDANYTGGYWEYVVRTEFTVHEICCSFSIR